MKRFLAATLAMSIAGCMASSDKYPSLALRPIESRSDAEPVAVTAPATPDAALDARVAAASANLTKLDTNFAASATKADAAIKARGAQATGSDQWLTAQAAVAEIEALRGDTLGAVSDLERIITDRGNAGQPPYPELDALRAKAQTQLDAQTARVVAIKAVLGEK